MEKTGKIPIAIQLYCVANECHADFAGTLKKLAAMGYEGVEFAGWHGKSAGELRKMLDDNGLKVAGSHTALTALSDAELPKTVEFNRILGNRFLVVPGIPKEERGLKTSWEKLAVRLNEIADKLQPHGMFTGYHNHLDEFSPIEGRTPWDIVFANTRQEVVMQIDTGNALRGGFRVERFLEKYPRRARTIHLKEYAADNPHAMLGEGDVRWSDVFRLADAFGSTEWYIVEQEIKGLPALETAERCLKSLRAMGR